MPLSCNIEPVERGFEIRPLVLDHLPRKTGAKNPLGHLGEPAVVGDRLQLVGRERLGQQSVQRVATAVKLGRPVVYRLIAVHAVLLRQVERKLYQTRSCDGVIRAMRYRG
jgi:hypothetical protein